MSANTNSGLFAGFETFASDDANTTEIVYGVNVILEQAVVQTTLPATTSRSTVAALVEEYRAQLGLPADVVVFIDGERRRNDDTVPNTARRIEFLKPAGQKGACDETSRISLKAEESVFVVVYRQVKVIYQVGEEPEVLGVISDVLTDLLKGSDYVLIGNAGPHLKTVGVFNYCERLERKLDTRLAVRGPADLDTISAMYPGAEITVANVQNAHPPVLPAGSVVTVVLDGGILAEEPVIQTSPEPLVEKSPAPSAQDTRRAELMSKKLSELHAQLKGMTGKGLFGANKCILVEEILKAEAKRPSLLQEIYGDEA